MKKKLHIAVACGGTGGHIFPGLATASALREHGHHVTLWLAGKGVEDAAVSGWKGPVVTIPSEGFQFGPLRSLLTAVRIGLAVLRCSIAMIRHRPDAVLAMGSYSSIGPCFAARLMRIPYVLHEANAVPGKAVRLLAKRSAATAVCFDETLYHLKGIHAVPVGMPLRPDLRPVGGDRPHPSSPFHLLVMGGSGGARAINEIVSKAVCCLVQSQAVGSGSLRVTHLTGPADRDEIAARYQAAGVAAEVHAFTHEMAPLYASASLAVCRAGASTCAELGVFGLPSLLIPYPHAAGDHQTANARALEKRGAADVIQQADMSQEWLADYLAAQMAAPDRLARMGNRSLARNVPLDAADRLAGLVESCARGKMEA